ncbi:MAG: hypothetical protein U1C74_33460, partial [Phenylobacterium sp.]|nr:hypothetical protein [Phenylobacterium sp.]
AADKVVVATGTAFSVELVRREVRVVLYEGRVALLQRKGPNAAASRLAPTRRMAEERLLEPGREVTLPEVPAAATLGAPPPAPRAASTVSAVDPVRSLSWEAGLLVFENEPLSVVVERMNRYAERPIRLGDANVGDLHVSGVFRAGDTDALTQGLNAAFNVRSRADNRSVTLFSTRYAGTDLEK